ncbi:Stp1/IreP family PP2C-type Ser/Thr phosphatase [Eggerthia catenaformis]|uniref:Stp1/IreP family PP2C-type Ser/Thr phosphatase n=1 Tax=Eggerthia catenaformis TaxID=31973 RepID=UPI0028EAD2F5|nr:Stp1/IreP family PP2C-type Ser/Thr phosphatase [Eggerthia catenaformis]
MYIASATDIGNIRSNNQDYVAFREYGDHEALCVLCDGMGGHKAGEVASEITGRYIIDHFDLHTPFTGDEMISQWMSLLIEKANHQVMEASSQNKDYEGMGTTCVICYIKDDDVYISHVGDSRCYSCNGYELRQITEDDTLVNELLKSGYITVHEASHHPQRNVLVQAVGVSDPLKISFYKEKFNQSFLICSDGLYNSLSSGQILDTLNSHQTIYEKAKELINLAKKYGGYDNISAMLIEKEVSENE